MVRSSIPPFLVLSSLHEGSRTTRWSPLLLLALPTSPRRLSVLHRYVATTSSFVLEVRSSLSPPTFFRFALLCSATSTCCDRLPDRSVPPTRSSSRYQLFQRRGRLFLHLFRRARLIRCLLRKIAKVSFSERSMPRNGSSTRGDCVPHPPAPDYGDGACSSSFGRSSLRALSLTFDIEINKCALK